MHNKEFEYLSLSLIHQRTFRLLMPQPNPTRLKRQLKANDIKTLIFLLFLSMGNNAWQKRGLMMMQRFGNGEGNIQHIFMHEVEEKTIGDFDDGFL